MHAQFVPVLGLDRALGRDAVRVDLEAFGVCKGRRREREEAGEDV